MFIKLVLIIFTCQWISIDSACQTSPFCQFDRVENTVVCDGNFLTDDQSQIVMPNLSCFPPVNKYIFRNLVRLRSTTFENFTFSSNEVLITLTNVSTIESNVFSNATNLPENARLWIDIENLNSLASINIESNAFNHIKIDRLRFYNLNLFNGRRTFDTTCFGDELDISDLIFDQCGLTGFGNSVRKAADVSSLAIINSPSLTQLTENSLPVFISTTKSLNISNTSLQIISPRTFLAWTLTLEELIFTGNSKLNVFLSNIVDGFLMKLHKLDLSDNAITDLGGQFNWMSFSYAKELVLRNQPLDLYLQTDILQTLMFLEKVDFSGGYVRGNVSDAIKTSFSSMKNLILLNLSRTNFSESLLIELLSALSETTDHFIDIHLGDYQLNDDNFCSYFNIYKNSPNLLRLHLDASHECNCVVDLFHEGQGEESTVTGPVCLHDLNRIPCNVRNHTAELKCNVARPNPTSDNSDEGLGPYALGGIGAGVAVLLIILILLGFGAIRGVRFRRNTDVDMEQPVENPLAAIIEERLQQS